MAKIAMLNLSGRNQSCNVNSITLPPISRELLLLIFSHCISACNENITSPQNTAISLSQVCSLWRMLVVETPTFWTRISLDYRTGTPEGANPSQAVETWLSRAGQELPLDLSLFVPKTQFTYYDDSEDEGIDVCDEESNKTPARRVSWPGTSLARRRVSHYTYKSSNAKYMNEAVASLAPSFKQWRSFSCCMSESLLARLLPFEQEGDGFAISCASPGSPFNLPLLETLDITSFAGNSLTCRGPHNLLLQPFTASSALTSVTLSRYSSRLRIGMMPWAQLRTPHLDCLNTNIFTCTTLELTQSLVQCSLLEDLLIHVDSSKSKPSTEFISPRHIMPSLRVLTLVVTKGTNIVPLHFLGSVTAPSLEDLKLSGKHKVNTSLHSTLCDSVTAFLQASSPDLTTLHLFNFYPKEESLSALFNAAAPVLDTVYVQDGPDTAVTEILAGQSDSETHWVLESDDNLYTHGPMHAEETMSLAPMYLFLRVFS